jgi:hypothetical protein
MYAWIWRQLPFGLPGKLGGSVALAGIATALLWFVIFPWLDPFIEQTLLPWNEGQLQGEFVPESESGNQPAPAVEGESEELVGPDGEVLEDEHDLPYDTDDDTDGSDG